MMSYPLARKGMRDPISSLRFDAFEVTWGGPSPTGGFCFGSEDGRVLFTDADGDSPSKPRQVTRSEEAINGVAFLQGWMGVSTRNEIVSWKSQMEGGAEFLYGAHDIIAGSSGYFFAPLGRKGLLCYRPSEDPVQTVMIYSDPSASLYFYTLISLPTPEGGEVLACAARTGGIAAMEFKGEDQPQRLKTATFQGLDVVDLCPLLPGEKSTAIAALQRDGTVILFQDVLNDRQPVTIKYEAIKGTAYRVLSARGYLFLLTSEGLYVLFDLVNRFLSGARDAFRTRGRSFPLEAVDANLVGDQWILIVMPDGVLRLDISLLQPDPLQVRAPDSFTELASEMLRPSWREQSSPLVSAVA